MSEPEKTKSKLLHLIKREVAESIQLQKPSLFNKLSQLFIGQPEYSQEMVSQIEIIGVSEFIESTKLALNLIEKTHAFQEIKPYLKRIQQGLHSGMAPWKRKPTFFVSEAIWKIKDDQPLYYSIYYASSIVHDGYHSLLYQKNKLSASSAKKDDSTWASSDAERACIHKRIECLEQMKMTEATLASYDLSYYVSIYVDYLILYLKSQAISPTYQEDLKSWKDFRKRNW